MAEAVIVWEYFCHGCKFLLSYIPTEQEKPLCCAHCQSLRIEVEAAGSERLGRLRFGDKQPDAPLTLLIIEEKNPST